MISLESFYSSHMIYIFSYIKYHNPILFCIYFVEIIAFLHCLQMIAPKYDVIIRQEIESLTKFL